MDDLDALLSEMSSRGARLPLTTTPTTPSSANVQSSKSQSSPLKSDGKATLNFSELDDLMADLVGFDAPRGSPLTSPAINQLSIPRQTHGRDRDLSPSSVLPSSEESNEEPTAPADSPSGKFGPGSSDSRVDNLASQMRDTKISKPTQPRLSVATLSENAGQFDGPASPNNAQREVFSPSNGQPSPSPTLFGAPGTAVDALTQLLQEQENITKRRSTMIRNPGPPSAAGGSRLSRDIASLFPTHNPSSSTPVQFPTTSRTPAEVPSATLPRGINTLPRPSTNSVCPQCELAVVGPSFTALNRIWHAECFVCRHCKKKLGSLTFFEHEGFPYCAEDYHELFSPRCGYCAGVITDQCITALGKVWHADHFFCCQCGRLFGDGVFNEHEGRAYCEEDFQNMFAPKCGACQKPVLDENIQALGKDWHPHCFVCKDCQKPFTNGSFLDFDNEPYCELHFHTRQGSLCGGCQRPIIGRCVTAIGKRFHPEHFTCQYCARQLSAIAFKQHQGKPYCQGCHVKLFG